ncbi:MAG: radical sam domain-containing protein [Proteiniphilum sp.]|nr:radical sam domain-containing protein [Proteiniphilum sp.]
MNEKILEKLSILADAAKYDVSCASSGTTRPAVKGGIGTATGWGICHSFTPDSDRQILTLASALYRRPSFKRVYYSGYIPVNRGDSRLPALAAPPLVRENRLYQADWLMRFYEFKATEIVDESHPDLDLDVDPKMGWALRHPEFFPVDVNSAPYEMILRVPGIGVKSAKLIVVSRRYGRLSIPQLKKIGVVMKRAQYFIVNRELPMQTVNELTPQYVRRQVTQKQKNRAAELLQYAIEWGE